MMKKIGFFSGKILSITLILCLVTLFSVHAQGWRQRGLRGGMDPEKVAKFKELMESRIENLSNTVSDVLLLEKGQADKVEKAARQSMDRVRDSIRSQWLDHGRQIGDDRQEMLNQAREMMADQFTQELKSILSENELKSVIPIIHQHLLIPIPELRALRLIELDANQRKELQPVTISFIEKILPDKPVSRGQKPTPEMKEKIKQEKAKFITQVNEKLSLSLQNSWMQKTAEVKKWMQDKYEKSQR